MVVSTNIALTGLDKIYDTFTTDPDKIHLYIQHSPYSTHINPDVVLEVNQLARVLTADEFMRYMNRMQNNGMMKYFQNCVLKDPVIHRILVKIEKGREIYPDDAVKIASWKRSNILSFKTFTTEEMLKRLGRTDLG